jgi:hypothetical protein
MNLRPLVFHPSERTAPREVIQHLREIDPSFDLHWVGNAWLLGRVRPTDLRYRQGGRVLNAELMSVEVDRGTIEYAKLAMQGFAATCSYDQPEADSRIVEDARERIYNLANRRESTFLARQDETLGGPKHRESMRQTKLGAENLAGEAWRRAFKRPVYSRPYSN